MICRYITPETTCTALNTEASRCISSNGADWIVVRYYWTVLRLLFRLQQTHQFDACNSSSLSEHICALGDSNAWHNAHVVNADTNPFNPNVNSFKFYYLLNNVSFSRIEWNRKSTSNNHTEMERTNKQHKKKKIWRKTSTEQTCSVRISIKYSIQWNMLQTHIVTSACVCVCACVLERARSNNNKSIDFIDILCEVLRNMSWFNRHPLPLCIHVVI